MGSRKLILLPQVLSMLTLWGANRLLRGFLTRSVQIFPCCTSLESSAQPDQIQSDLARYLVSQCPACLPILNSILAKILHTSQVKPDLAKPFVTRCRVYFS